MKVESKIEMENHLRGIVLQGLTFINIGIVVWGQDCGILKRKRSWKNMPLYETVGTLNMF